MPPRPITSMLNGDAITRAFERENLAMNLPQKTWWHELSTWEPETALAIYGRTLGWKFEPTPLPGGASYWIARKDGKPVGGIFALTAPDYEGIPSHWMTYMSVPDIGQAESDTTRAGGEVMRAATEVPGVGKLAVVSDSTGALIGLIEPAPFHASSRFH